MFKSADPKKEKHVYIRGVNADARICDISCAHTR